MCQNQFYKSRNNFVFSKRGTKTKHTEIHVRNKIYQQKYTTPINTHV